MRGISTLSRTATRVAPAFLGRSLNSSTAFGVARASLSQHAMRVPINAQSAQHNSNASLFCRTYSTEQPPKKTQPVNEKESSSGSSSNNPRSPGGDGGIKDVLGLLPSSGPLSPIGIVFFLLTSAGIVYFFTVTKEQVRAEREKSKNKSEVVGKADVGGPFELTDQDGNTVTDKSLLGKFALIYFGFCHCPDICPEELDKIGEAMDILERNPKTKDAVQLVFVTCDPQRDSPTEVKKYLQQFHPGFIGLTGSVDQIAAMCKAYRVYFSKPPRVDEGQDYLVDHAIFSYFMDPDGEFIDVYGKDKTATTMASDIERRVTQFLNAGRKLKK
ncbi:Cu-binding protein [Coemansia aciculifera]|uniref:Cu-binding protein n=1 Tax=Coemansia aciculifera TaxID=417176 RepID=A0A9W8IGW4_9FUNG|nr:Cu-binding protein [Coemansia aciculifera]KAJ2874132.1 Cu-binding protein [Coemansia aciculifera]